MITKLQDWLFRNRIMINSTQAAVVRNAHHQQFRHEACCLWCMHASGSACHDLLKSQLHPFTRQLPVADLVLQQAIYRLLMHVDPSQ